MSAFNAAVDLWLEYETTLRGHLQNINLPVLRIRYEQLLLVPDMVLEALAQFLGCPEGALDPRDLDLDPDRAYAFRRDARLCEQWAQIEARADIPSALVTDSD